MRICSRWGKRSQRRILRLVGNWQKRQGLRKAVGRPVVWRPAPQWGPESAQRAAPLEVAFSAPSAGGQWSGRRVERGGGSSWGWLGGQGRGERMKPSRV